MAIGKRSAAEEQLCTLLDGDIDVAVGGFNLAGIHLRPHFNRLVQSVADLELFSPFDKPFREVLRNALLQQDAAGGGAALAGGAEGAPERAVEREIEIGVVEHDHGVLAAHLKRHLLEGGRGLLCHQRAHFARSGKADGTDIGMLHQRVAHRTSAAVHNVQHAVRYAGVHQGLDQVVDRKRRVGGRFDHAGVTRNQGREQLPARDGHGEVPRRDHPHHAQGHADAHGELVLQFARSGFAEEAAPLAGDVKSLVNGLLHVAPGFGQHFAHLAGHVVGKLLLALAQQLAGAEQDLGAFGRGHQPPGGEGLFCGGYGRGHIGWAGGGKFADDVGVVGRVDIQEGFAAIGGHPLAADQIQVS